MSPTPPSAQSETVAGRCSAKGGTQKALTAGRNVGASQGHEPSGGDSVREPQRARPQSARRTHAYRKGPPEDVLTISQQALTGAPILSG